MPSYCLVPSCTASSNINNGKRIFHVLPTDQNLCAKWLQAIGLNSYADNVSRKRGSYRICSDHFDDSSYETKRVLLRTAIPTLNLRRFNNSVNKNKSNATNSKTKSDPDPDKPSASIEIDEHSLRVEINRRLEMEASMLAAGPSTSEDFLKYSRKFLSPKTLKLLTCQLLMKEDDKRKIPVKHKLICLDLYYHNPRAYGLLQQFVSLPPISSLRKLHLNVNSGFVSPRCLILLRSMLTQMNAKDKCCVVGLASTPVKKHVYYDITNDIFRGLQQVDQKQWRNPVKEVYVLVASGLHSSWQMPVAYALVPDCAKALQFWSSLVIQNLIHEGFDVCAFISNLGDENSKKLSELRNISSENNTFELLNKTIWNIFDMSFLVKSLRDSLKESDLSIPFKGVASWEHIETFYNSELTCLIHDRGNTEGDQGSSTEHALQLFSKPVVTALRAFLKMKLLDVRAVVTVNFIHRVSELIDLLKSNTIKHDPQNKKFTGKESEKKILIEVIEYLDGVRKVSKGVLQNEKLEPIEGLLVTVKSVYDLWNNLSNKGGTHLLTRSLNLEFVEDCFREIAAYDRKRKNKCDQVTTIEFMRGFNKSFLNNFIRNARHNSSKKIKSSLSKLKDYLAEKTTEIDTIMLEKMDLEVKKEAIKIDNLDHKIKLPKQKVIRYIAAYLMTKALEKHSSCINLIRYMIPPEEMTSTFIDCEYLEVRLPVEFVLFVVKMEHEFVKVFEEDSVSQELGERALRAMNNLVILPCCCFPLFLVKKLFIRLRIYNAVKDINRQLKKKDVFKINAIDL